MPNLIGPAKSAQAKLVSAGYTGTATIPTSVLQTLLNSRFIRALRFTGLATVSGSNTIVNLTATPVPRRGSGRSMPDNP